MDGLKFRNRSGSALIIVLGMLAFMVISAVAFSAYMRYSRLPSSFLRRSVASRMLVKAALARAVDEIDVAIGNNPHPNIGEAQYCYPRSSQSSGKGTGKSSGVSRANRNHWKARVYMGGTNGNARTIPFVPQHSTVSPLTLEGLAYLPPSIINEVRYYSRHTQTARWQDLDYDAGRYAFCAVDVSDYFDINAVHADVPRGSTDGMRISLAHLFESKDHRSATALSGFPSTEAWDEFMSAYLPDGTASGGSSAGSKLPLISMADFNVAVNYHKPGGLLSPFFEYLRSGRMYEGSFNAEGDLAERVRRMTFVTDSYFPGNEAALQAQAEQSGKSQQSQNGSSQVFDLSLAKNQPFELSMLKKGQNIELRRILDYSNSAWDERFKFMLSGVEGACLFDYLDEDSVPVSLAIPTCERVPMICAIQPQIEVSGLKLNSVPKDDISPAAMNVDPPPSAGLTRKVTHEVVYKIDGSTFRKLFTDTRMIKTLLVYPFRHKGEAKNFTVDGAMAAFFSNGDIKSRTSSASAMNLVNDDLKNLSNAKVMDGFVMAPIQSTGAGSFGGKDVDQEESTDLFNSSVELAVGNCGSLQSDIENVEFLKVTYEWDEKSVDPGTGAALYWDKKQPDPSNLKTATCGFLPLKANGTPDTSINTGLAGNLKGGSWTKEFELNVALWLRVKDSEGKFVDVVPACVEDDRLNGKQGKRDAMTGNLGAAYPLLRFNLGAKVKFQSTATDHQNNTLVQFSTPDGKAEPQVIVAGDPRYNHAPESWFAPGDTSLPSPTRWLELCGRRADTTRDGDIFMHVSDRCYLQSIYELAHIARTSGGLWNSSGKNIEEGYVATTRNWYESEVSKTDNFRWMWRTFCPWADYDTEGFEGHGFCFGSGGFNVSPYAETNILVAAFANTPRDWRYTFDPEWLKNNGGPTLGDKISQDVSNLSGKEFNRRNAWNEYSNGPKLTWRDVSHVAQMFHNEVMDLKSDEIWQDAFAKMAWEPGSRITSGEASDYLLFDSDGELDSSSGPIFAADRKFLYGYWHDCFSAQQQLFLVFVRAEPRMMGGGMAGAIPPSLGARAVALVWRDPNATKLNSNGYPNPHRTRVLFYRQFD